MKEIVTNPKELIWNQATLRGSLSAWIDIDREKNRADFSIGMNVPYVNKTTNEKELRAIWHNITSYNPRDFELLAASKPNDFIEVTGKLSTGEDAWDRGKKAQIILSGDSSSLQLVSSVKEAIPSTHVTLIGNIGGPPQHFYENTNGTFASLNLAVNSKWTDKETNEKRQHSHWHSVIITGAKGVAFACEHLRKGTCIQVKGQLSYEHWRDKHGVDHTKPRIFVHSMEQLKILEFTPQKVISAPAPIIER
jgi:single stranded DNA-binding protein